MHYRDKVQQAIQDLQQGKMILLSDNEHRENEGDLVFAAEFSTPEKINFLLQNCSGIICLSISNQHAKKLNLSYMVDRNSSRYGTPFTVSIEARKGVSSGVSAADRNQTILTAINPEAKPNDLARPGHVYPLIAESLGVLARSGHTEGSYDLMRLSGLNPSAVLCEVMNSDGSMTKGEELHAFAQQHQLTHITIQDIIHYRKAYDDLVCLTAKTEIELKHYGTFSISVYSDLITGQEHLLLSKGTSQKNPLVRLHSCCLSGDLLGSLHCDCQPQLHYALEEIAEKGGHLLYLNQEGRGIGLSNKIKAYQLQREGMNTVEANQALGFEADERDYAIGAQLLRSIDMQQCQLLTNNPDKVNQLNFYGVNTTRVSMPIFDNPTNQVYLQTKKALCGHLMEI